MTDSQMFTLYVAVGAYAGLGLVVAADRWRARRAVRSSDARIRAFGAREVTPSRREPTVYDWAADPFYRRPVMVRRVRS